MHKPPRIIICLLLVLMFILNVIPCGPAYLTPVFHIRSSPEFPYEDFAAGQLGIIRPEFHRSVLFAAHRYVNGGGFTADEQKALVEVWRAEFRKEDFRNVDVDSAVNAWVEKRKSVAGADEKLPAIYVEREYGGYDFFPNCTVNAFETATATLSDRTAMHGSEDRHVKEWLNGQDTVFANCASGKRSPVPSHAGMPEWLQKDRAYQMAAAAFYSLDYDEAKNRFAQIALDFASPWQETADYLVARTLIRQASLANSKEASTRHYQEAEPILARISASGGQFAVSADQLLGLIKYRLRPAERLRELSQKLSFFGGNVNFRQDLIDYTWLMDKFEKSALEEAERRMLTEKLRAAGIDPDDKDLNADDLTGEQQSALRQLKVLRGENPYSSRSTDNRNAASQDKLQIRVYAPDYSANWSFEVEVDATDDETIVAAERVIGAPLSDEIRKRVIDARQYAYSGRYSSARGEDYEGGYWGDSERSLSALPKFLLGDELTNWLFTYQIRNKESYLYSLERYKQTSSDLWLMTAISKADAGSAEIDRLLVAAGRVSRSSPAFLTIAFNGARVYIEKGQTTEALRLIDEAVNTWPNMPVSSMNQFLGLRQKLSVTLDDYLRASLRKPFIFEYGSALGSLDQLIEMEKGYYDPEYHKEGREAYENEVEERFATERQWQDRRMLDDATVNTINLFFPASVLGKAYRSEVLPGYMKERFAIAIWTRALLLDDLATVERFGPVIAGFHPSLAEPVRFIETAPGPGAKKDSAVYLVLKNPMMTPLIESGLGKTDNDPNEFDGNDWWCEPYDTMWDPETGDLMELSSIKRPAFLSSDELEAAAREREKLKEIGDASAYLGKYVLEWSRRSPEDPRIPESIYLAYKANGLSKYGCGGNPEVQSELGQRLRSQYPANSWTQRLNSEIEGQN